MKHAALAALGAVALALAAAAFDRLETEFRSARAAAALQAQSLSTLDRELSARLDQEAHERELSVRRVEKVAWRSGHDLAERIDAVDRATQEIPVRLDQALDERVVRVREEVRSAAGALRELDTELAQVRDVLRADPERLARRVLAPSVQVNGRDTIGGGVMVACYPEEGGTYTVYILSAYHVVQKVVARIERHEPTPPIEVKVYGEDGTVAGTFPAAVAAFDPGRDVSLLTIAAPEPPAHLAHLMPRHRIHALSTFTPIYAVGCPLGHDPMPTSGEISTTHKRVNGSDFWMVNAPTIFGNSGGGIFHRDTHELIGLSAMICTYDGIVSTPVPHMSIMTSLDAIYDWLDERDLAFLYDPALPRVAHAKADY